MTRVRLRGNDRKAAIHRLIEVAVRASFAGSGRKERTLAVSMVEKDRGQSLPTCQLEIVVVEGRNTLRKLESTWQPSSGQGHVLLHPSIQWVMNKMD